MSLEPLQIGRARLRVGPWRGRTDRAYVVAVTSGDTLTTTVLHQLEAQLSVLGYTSAVSAAVAPVEREAFAAHEWTPLEELHLMVHHLDTIPEVESPTGSRISRGSRLDWDRILDIDSQTFDSFWQLDRDGLADALNATPTSRLRVVRTRFGPVAYCATGRAQRSGYLQRLAVDPQHQGKRLGRLLVRDALTWMKRRHCETGWVNTQLHNSSAVGLYESMGFTYADHRLTVMTKDLW
jgi:ribosomal protein S18 acetylase RimI-like enzyme